MSKKISKQLFYKHAEFLNKENDTLQNLYKKAIAAVPISQRGESISGQVASGPGAAWVRLINSPRHASGFSFGVMVLYSPGIHHMVIDMAAAAGKDELDVSKLPPPAGKQFMETPLYFAIRDNHVVFIQSKALRAADLEIHLNWLLAFAGVIDDSQRVTLSDTIPESTRKRLEKEPVRSLRIGVPLVEKPIASSGLGGKVSTAFNKIASGLGLDAIKGLLSGADLTSLRLEDLTETPDIEVNIEIRVTGRRKSSSKDAKIKKLAATEAQMMGTLMKELRHVEDVSFLHVETEGGGRLHGNELRVQVEKGVDSSEGILSTSHAFEVMRMWLSELIGHGTINAEE